MLANLQALRALAAISVVIFHVGLMPPTKLPFAVGAAGVDLFFVLSGFIIAYSSSRDPRRFLARRLIRILPAYWIATVIAALFALEQMTWRDTAGWLLQSMFYLPDPTGRPVLIFVAWTLVYELAFYLIYWLALREDVRRAPIAALLALVPIALVKMPGLPEPWPLFLEFAIGIGVFLATERSELSRYLRKGAGLAIAGIGVALIPALPRPTGYSLEDYDGVGRVLTWGLPAGGIVFGAVIAERAGLAVKSHAVLMLGAASYAIYLLHPIAIGQLLHRRLAFRPPARPFAQLRPSRSSRCPSDFTSLSNVRSCTNFVDCWAISCGPGSWSAEAMMRGPSDSETAHRRGGGLLRSLRQLVVVLHETLRDLPARRWYLTASCAILLSCLLAIVRHEPDRVPPPAVFFAGLPVSGKLDDALRAGFDDCFATDAVNMRCRRHAVTIANTGPYEAAVDLKGSRGAGGFDQLVIWHDRDNYAVFQIADALRRAGWKQCYTGDDRWGDQSIFMRSGSAVRASMDMSYYSKRRMRMIPEWNRRERRCVPEQ